MSISVLVADGQPVVRVGVRRFLVAPGITVVGEAATGSAAVSAASHLRPDVIVLDPMLPDVPGPHVCRQILEHVPAAAVAIFSASVEAELVAACAEAGASAYLVKDDEELDLADAVRRVAAGERLVDPRAAAAVLRARSANPTLSTQELRVLRLAAQGFTNREIGARLFLSRHTVKEYLSNAMRKLDVASRVQAVVEADRRGLLEPPPLSRAS